MLLQRDSSRDVIGNLYFSNFYVWWYSHERITWRLAMGRHDGLSIGGVGNSRVSTPSRLHVHATVSEQTLLIKQILMASHAPSKKVTRS